MRIPWIFAIVVGIISVVTDIYIWSDIKRNYPRCKWGRMTYSVTAVLCWIGLASVVFLPYRSASENIIWIMWLLYSLITIYVAKIVFVIFSLLGRLPDIVYIIKGKPVNSLKSGKWIGLPLAIVVFATMWWGALVTRKSLQVNEVTFVSDRLPAGFDGYRIVQISDLHVGTWGSDTRFISKLVDTVNACHPDVILFTGDIVNRETAEMAPFLKTLTRLKAPDGVFSVLGNHDYGDYIDWPSKRDKAENMQLMYEWQRIIGWDLLNNTHRQLIHNADTLQLIGVENWGEPPFHQYGHLTDACPIDKDSLRNLRDGRFKILMTHNPEHWRQEVTKISNIDLTLSGHTHAMQMVFDIFGKKWSPAEFKYEEWGGLYHKFNSRGDKLSIYVNIGAGEVGMPFRIGGAMPEITVITLKRPGENVISTDSTEV